MATTLPRVTAVLEPTLYDTIQKLAREDGVSLSQKTRDLLLQALELVEDTGLEKIVEHRRKNRAPSISHAELKKRIGIK